MLRWKHPSRLVVAATATAVALFTPALPALPAAADTAPVSPATATTVSADVLPTVQINGVVWAQVIVGNTVYATGKFTTARPAGSPAGSNEVTRSNIVAYNLTTGVLNTSWAPSLNAQGMAIAASPDGSRIYVVGDFTQVNGVNRYRVAAFDASTGALLNFNPALNARARAMAVTADGTVYVGGSFTTANSQNRTRLAAFSPTGTVLPWAPAADAEVLAMTAPPNSGKIIVGGRFANLATTPDYGLGALDASTGAVLPFAANGTVQNGGPDAGIWQLSSDATQVYGAGYTFGGGGNFEGSFGARTDTGAITWINGCRGDVYSTAPIGGVLYSVGHPHDCGMIGQYPQTDPWTYQRATATTTTPGADGRVNTYGNFTGVPAPEYLHWLPTLTAGTVTGQSQAAWSVTGTSQYVVLGGEFPSINGTAQQGLARFAIKDIAPNKQGPQGYAELQPTLTSLAPGTLRVAWQAAWDRDNERLTYEVLRGASAGTATVISTGTMDSAWWNRPPMAFTDSTAPAGSTQTYRIRVKDVFGNSMTSNTTSATVPGGTVGATPYKDAVRGDSPTSYWPLGEADGTTGYDWIGADDLTLDASATRNVPGAITSENGKATTFTGAATVPAVSKTLQNGPNTFTAEAWFSTTSTSGGKIVGFGNSNNGGSGGYDRHVYMTNDGHLVFGVYTGNTQTLVTPGTYNDGSWHQVVAEMSSAGMVLYVDGKKIGSRADTTTGQPYQGYWRIGGDNLGGWPNQPASSSFAGSIDDVSVYPTALPLAKVQAHFTASGRTIVTPTRPADTYGKAVYDDQPDTYWRLDDTSGTNAVNTMTAAASGTYTTGVTLGTAGSPASSSTGKSVTFPGGPQTLVSTDRVSNPTVYSVEAWFNTTTTTGGRIFGFGDAQSGPSSNYDRHVYMLDSGQLRYGIFNGQLNLVDSPLAYNDGKWHQVVATQGPAGQALYVDGALVGSSTVVTPQAYDGYWRLGSDNTWGGASTNDFTGALDEVSIYSSTLTAATIAQHYQAGSGTTPPPPPNQAPTASFTSTTSNLTAALNGSASSDPDGTIASYAWNFGDSTTGTGATVSHPYATAGTYQVTLTVTDNGGATGTVTKAVTVTAAPPADPTVGKDAFGRTVASGFGTADTGGAWTTTGAGVTTSGADGSGRVVAGVGRSGTFRLAGATATDTDLTHTVWLEAVPTGGGVYLSTAVRSTATADYRARLRIQSTGAILFNLTKNVSGTETGLTTQITLPGITYTAGMKLHVRVQAVGNTPTTLRARVWVDGQTEPTTWTQTVTDSTAGLQADGAVALVTYNSGSSTTSPVARYDDLAVAKL